jgi:outer membrane protein OmpA-like peptidoglycan-associated protein
MYNGFAQTRLEIADEAFDSRQYSVALQEYKKVLSGKVKNRSTITYKVAECYRYLGKYEEALQWYERADNEGFNEPQLTYHQAAILMKTGNYQEAENKINKFLSVFPNDKSALRMLENIRYAQKMPEKPPLYTAQNVSALNTPYSDYGLAPLKNRFVFTSSRIESNEELIYTYDGQGFSDLYEVFYHAKDKTWTKPLKITPLCSPFNDGNFSYCEKNKTAYFTQCNNKSGKPEHCTIYESIYDEFTNNWSKPQPILTSLPENTDIAHPSVSADGQYLYFSSRKEDGKGGSDIWVMQKTGNRWDNAQNLGELINTEWDEMFPMLYNDTTLYFASEGHEGYGGLDLFVSIRKEGYWTKPVNLKTPFNSSADDFALVFLTDKNEGYFASNRPGGSGSDDIYYFFLTPITLVVKGKVTDVDSRLPLKGATVVLSAEDGFADTILTNADGTYEFKLDRNKDYKINAITSGYFGDSKKLSTQGEMYSKEFSKATGYNYDFAIKKIPKEEIRIDDIYYDYNSYALREESKPNLDKLVKLLEDTPGAIIQINSHTDERGSFKYNMELSENRAKSVVLYLIEKGIDPARLSSKGYGFTMPVVKNAKTEEEHQLNRRTTFKVISND